MSESNKVWYASYGSNLLAARFRTYIQGGKPPGGNYFYSGCRDKGLPLASRPIGISHRVYFAHKAKIWGQGGVAFIENEADPQHQTLGRMHMITKAQFVDLVRQENLNEEALEIDFDKAIEQGSLIVKDPAWYGKLLYLGAEEGYPIFTFSTAHDLKSQLNPPSPPYLKTIIEGIKESHALSEEAIAQYFLSLEGVEGFYSEQELLELVRAPFGS